MASTLKVRSALLVVLCFAVVGVSIRPVEAADPCGLVEPLALGDFNGDGSRDLVIGSPKSIVSNTIEAGVVHVIYGVGSGAGLFDMEQQLWHLESPGVEGTAYTGAHFGRSLAVGDFDCDGIDDLAIGEEAPVVTILLGYFEDPDGLSTDGLVRLTGAVGSQYGSAIAAGDFFGPAGCDDLAVGVPGSGGGEVWVYTSQQGVGLVPESLLIIDQDSPGVPGSPEPEDDFGEVLAVGNFDGDAFDDLAVGVPGESLGFIGDGHGAVNVLHGGNDGFDLARSQIWHQDVDWVMGEAEQGDNFGASLAAGDLDGDGYDELIAGVPGEDISNSGLVLSDNDFGAGAINVIPGSSTGLVADGSTTIGRIWHQGSEGIKGSNESFDYFGSSVAAGDFDGNGADDLAASRPGEDREGFAEDCGLVHVIDGTSDGLTDSGDTLIHQNTDGEWVTGSTQVSGDLQDDDEFGCAQVAGDLNDDEFDDLVVTVRDGSDIAANVIFGSSSGLSADGDYWVCSGGDGCDNFQVALNLPSNFAPVTDGIVTDPPGTGEWSDVRPMAFSLFGAAPVAVDPDDIASTDSAFYAALGPEPDATVAYLNLLFQFPLRTDPSLVSQEPVATIRFPATIPGTPEGKIIGVHLLGAGPGIPAWPPNAWLDLDSDGRPDDDPGVPASNLGIEVAAGFAASGYEATPHLQIEMRVPLSIPAGFPDPSGPLAAVPDGPGGVYTPAPGLWTVDYRPDSPATLVPGAMALLEIDPRGALAGSANVSVQHVVDVVLLDDSGDGNNRVTLGILSSDLFDATAVTQHQVASAGDPGRLARPLTVSTQNLNGDSELDQVLEFSDYELLANKVLTLHGHDIVLTGQTASGTIAGTVTGLMHPQAGSIPNGDQVPGAPLTIRRAGNPDQITLSWGSSCAGGDANYAVYEGTLGDFGSHRPVTCFTASIPSRTLTPGPGNHYYLVVQRTREGVEGSYGVTSGGVQRPQGVPSPEDPPGPIACAPQSIGPACEP